MTDLEIIAEFKAECARLRGAFRNFFDEMKGCELFIRSHEQIEKQTGREWPDEVFHAAEAAFNCNPTIGIEVHAQSAVFKARAEEMERCIRCIKEPEKVQYADDDTATPKFILRSRTPDEAVRAIRNQKDERP